MREREQQQPARIAAEAMYGLWELEHQQSALDIDRMMMRLKDLSAYSLRTGDAVVDIDVMIPDPQLAAAYINRKCRIGCL